MRFRRGWGSFYGQRETFYQTKGEIGNILENYVESKNKLVMAFNENTRVKIPAILHLCRLGFKYVSLSKAKWDINTNIFPEIFTQSILRLNSGMDKSEVKRVMEMISLTLDNEDLGFAFYQQLTTNVNGYKILDLDDFERNSLHIVTELTYKKDDEEFRPDITLLINGMPLAFVEVKKPNNHEGILAERDRINVRFKNKKFRRFINLFQILVFSNNMEYDIESIEPIQGAFYSTTSYHSAIFNCFREEEEFKPKILFEENENTEDLVLKDNNLAAIKYSPEFLTNKNPETPTNRILSSLFSKQRLPKLLKYAIAYVRTEKGLEKHIMRYPQLFATLAIETRLEKGIRKGIIWHTQGSGKTALSYYNVHYLTDYFQKKGIVPKFYFIVDRLDLLQQAEREFRSRGLVVHSVNSKNELLEEFRQQKTIHNFSGKREITVVNIQKFQDDSDFLRPKEYNINIQRIYFLDEVHRSYDPKGSFLANLYASDRNAILIGLTGTPLIGKDRKSKDTFGDYIHKYYYNSSIADGYTLKLIREGIETKYKILLEEALKGVEILKGDAEKRLVYAHERFVEPMLDYIVLDFLKSRLAFKDETVGAMVVCDSSDQAKKLFQIFVNRYNPSQKTAETVEPYNNIVKIPVEYHSYQNSFVRTLTASLVLYDIGSKEERKTEIEDFKIGKTDILFVYNMLLTGFDAHRLKKLYIGRIIKDHNLLQTLTRVNRPYKNFRYGYVVDFADIRKEFKATNQAYFEELQDIIGKDEMQTYSDMFKSVEEIETEIKDIKEKLFHYDLSNSENFSLQINQIKDRKTILELKKALENAKSLYNLIRLSGKNEMLEKLDFQRLGEMYREVSYHLDILNFRESIQNDVDTANLLNAALENVIFHFRKISEDELIIADALKESLRKTREALGSNFDQDDPVFISLYDELKRLFDKKNLDELSQDEMKENIDYLNRIFEKVTELNRKNNLLKAKYESDAKYARVHKRILEKGSTAKNETALHTALTDIKKQTDEKVLNNQRMLSNESYFTGLSMQTVIQNFEKADIELEPDSARYINSLIVKEYMKEFQGGHD